ncbi:U6 snRNA-associated Sm-like protein LSm6 isoform X1 [Hylaeus volcanicus]|uniref:U6 snRNA-associated Sm-like protein LSm6 isoform X1 n=1 Tax=Hylaeus volcanicus TaxID=313075 RepID=UPI0023B87DE8|nr:U6 snRNA-associated Sm-like protein LSm6 isoform X1 [Hylaeus volcanicus]
MSARNPSDFLKQVLGRSVIVRLNSGTDFKGLLACLDDRMNVAMEQVEEIEKGITINKYSDAFIRGNNEQQRLNLVQINGLFLIR